MAVFHGRLAKPSTSEHWLLLTFWASCSTPLCVHVFVCSISPVLLMTSQREFHCIKLSCCFFLRFFINQLRIKC